MEFSAKERNPFINRFSNGEHAGNDFIYSGVFYNHNKHYGRSLANILHKIKTGNSEEAFKDFERFIERTKEEVQGDALYDKRDVVNLPKPFKIFGSKPVVRFYRRKYNDKVEVGELSLSSASFVGKASGLVFLRLKGYEDQPLSRELKWELYKKFINLWLKHGSGRKKEFLERALEYVRIFEVGLGMEECVKWMSKAVYYFMPVNFDKFLSAVMVSSVSLFYRKDETRKYFWERFLRGFKEENQEWVLKLLEYALEKNGKTLEDLRGFIQLALEQEHLDVMREDWKGILRKAIRGEVSELFAVFLDSPKRTDKWFSYGVIELPVKEVCFVCFAEKDYQVNGQTVSSILRSIEGDENVLQYLGGLSIKFDLDGDKPYSLGELFYFSDFESRFLKEREEDKKVRRNEYLPQDAKRIAFALLHFAAKLSDFVSQSLRSGILKVPLIILGVDDLEEEDDRSYPLWNEVSALYDLFGFPAQTVTMRFFRKYLEGKENSSAAVVKNMVLSLLGDLKRVRFSFGGFALPEKLTVFVVLERPSAKFHYNKGDWSAKGQRHYVYDLYKIEVKGNEAEVSLEDRYFIFADGYGGDIVKFESWARQQVNNPHTRLFFVSADENSLLFTLKDKLIDKPSQERKIVSVLYKELKTAYLSPKAIKSCYVIYSDEMQKVLRRLGIEPDKKLAVVALKPAPPPAPKDNELYHVALQVFYTEKVGWLSEEVYEAERDLLLFVLIALSNFGSDSFTVPYAKLSLSTERTRYLRFRRDMKEFLVPIRPMVYELVYSVLPLPEVQDSQV